MPLLVGGVALVVLVLAALGAGRARADRSLPGMLLGAAAVGAILLVLARAGPAWVAVGLVLLWFVTKRFARDRPAPPPGSAPPRGRARMSAEEAREVLGVAPEASRDEIQSAFRRLVKKYHPDQGGSAYLTRRINEARDVLLG